MDEVILARFMSKVRPNPGGCWLWSGMMSHNGYGRFSISHAIIRSAHRLAYEHWVGPIPEGKQIDHLCRVRNCVNPEHLRVVTARENVLGSRGHAAANAAKTHCPKGHAYDEANTYRTKAGTRMCRECLRVKSRAFYHAHKGYFHDYYLARKARA